MITRRDFLRIAMLAPVVLESMPGKLYAGSKPRLKEALYYQKIDGKKMTVSCQLCPRAVLVQKLSER